MINIYDILLNWSDSNQIYDFFEWEVNDEIEHIKRIPLLKINESDYNTILSSDIQVDKQLLDLIKNRTEIYTNKKAKQILYAVLLTDGIRTFAVEFNKKGENIYKSKMLLDEEEETIDVAYKLQVSRIKYKVIKKYKINVYETRLEHQKQSFLDKELDSIYEKHEVEKLKYLYVEYFNKSKDDLDSIYHELKDSLKKGMDFKHNKLYELLKLSYVKKLVK